MIEGNGDDQMIMNNADDYAWQCPNCGELNPLHDNEPLVCTNEWILEQCRKRQELFVMENPIHKEDD